MKIIEKYRNLKVAAKRTFVLLMIVSLISTATGIGSIFVYAEPGDETTLEGQTPSEDITQTDNTTNGEGSAQTEDNSSSGNDVTSDDQNASGDTTTNTEGTTTGDTNTTDGTTTSGTTGNAEGTTGTTGTIEGTTGSEGTSGTGTGATGIEGTTGTESTTGTGTSGTEGTTGTGTTGTEGTTGTGTAGTTTGITGTEGAEGTKGTTGTTGTTEIPADHEHEYTYTPNGDGTHTKKCIVEGCTFEEVKEDCTFTEGVCEFCLATKPEETEEYDHEHIYSYISNENGTHTKKCTIEGCTLPEVIEECTYEDGKCKFCEAEDPNAGLMLRAPMNRGPEPEITYDGDSELKSEYYYNVKFKAEGWEIKLKDEPDTAYVTEYVYSQLGPNQNLVLVFRNLADPTVTCEKKITISIVGAPTTPLKYNGADLKSSYTGDVTITCDGYAIAGEGSSDFASSYTVAYIPVGGIHEEVLQLKNATGILPVKISIKFDGDIIPPVITEITTTKTTAGAQMTLRGTDEGSGIGCFYIIARVKDGTEKEPSIGEFLTPAATEIAALVPAAQEDTGAYYANTIITGLDETKTYVFYVLADDDAGNFSEVRAKVGYSQEISIDIKYNGESLKSWFNSDVKVTAEGYMISENLENKYHSEYVFSGTGKLTKTLDFKRIVTGVVKTYDITVNIDKAAPAVVINSNDYNSNKFVTGDDVAFYTNTQRNISISASDDLSGVDVINYYVSETYYNNVTDLLAGMSNDKKSWRTYSQDGKFTLVEDKANYIFVRVTDKAGNVTYVSTGKIICDTTAPTMTTLTAALAQDGNGTIVGFAGKDTLSGINRFKLIYREKTSDKMTAPSKDDIFNNGQYIETGVSSGTDYGATVTIGNLEAQKVYVFYGAAVDRAGNVSEVMTYEGTPSGQTAQAAAAAAGLGASGAAGAGGAAGAAKSSLTPAPSGIAGSGTGSGTGAKGGNGTGSSSSASGKSSSSSSSPLDREINRQPYISDATGSTKIGLAATGGWNNIVSEIKKADYNSSIDVEMSGLSEIPSGAIDAIAGKPVTVAFKMPQDVEWVIKGENVEGSSAGNIDLGVKIGSKSIPQNVLDDVTESNPHFEFEIAHEGDFGFTASLFFPVGKTNAGLYANLYHYNPEKKELNLEGTSVVNSDGYAVFEVSHASAFTVVVTAMPLMSNRPEVITTGEQSVLDNDSLSSSDVLLRVPDLFGLKGQVRLYLFLIGIICAALCVMILFLPNLQLQRRQEESVFDFRE